MPQLERLNNHNAAEKNGWFLAFGEHFTQAWFSLLPILPLRLIVVRRRVEAGADDDVADGRLRLLAVQFVGTLQAQAVGAWVRGL